MKTAQIWIRFAFAGLATQVMACAAPVDGSLVAPKVDEGSVAAEAVSTTPTSSGPLAPVTGVIGAVTLAPTPPPAPDCAREKPYYVAILPDRDSNVYNDGYTIPFPTPWITNLLGQDPQIWVYAPDVWNYENVIAKGPYRPTPIFLSHVPRENLVVSVYVNDGSITGVTDGDMKQFFLSGFRSLTDWNDAWTLANAYGAVSDVQSRIKSCVHVMRPGATFKGPATEIAYFPFAEEHDPTRNPNPP